MPPDVPVVAGPVEATALGNIAMQMLATGAVSSLARGAGGDRALVPGRALRAGRGRSLEHALPALSRVRGVDLCLRRSTDRNAIPEESLGRRGGGALAVAPLELLRYRSNLLGADLRITNFGGGNTSSKFELPDPLTGEPQRVMAVKGSGGDLRSIGTVRLRDPVPRQARTADRALPRRGVRGRDGRRSTRCARSARTASPRRSTRRCTRSCRSTTSTICIRTGRSRWRRAPTAGEARRVQPDATAARIIWVPWQRPGFELALMLKRAVEANPGCDGLILGGHGLFTWGDDAEGVLSEQRAHHRPDGGVRPGARATREAARRCSAAPGSPARSPDREAAVIELFPSLRGRSVVEPARHRPLSTAATTRSSSPTRRGPRTSARWARAVPIISCAPASRRCSSRGIRRRRTLAALKDADRRAHRHVS